MLPTLVVAFLATIALPVAVPMAAAKPVKCAIPNACATFTNTSTGQGVSASSASGIGAYGISSSGTFLGSGIDGESTNQDGQDVGGGFGIDFFVTGSGPFYGALGYGSGTGLYGETESAASAGGSGVFGYDSGGGRSSPNYNAGVVGRTGFGTGVLGEANGGPRSSVFGLLPTGIYGFATSSSNGGIGVVGESDNDVGMIAINDATYASVGLAGPSLLVNATTLGGYFQVTNAGSAYLSGTLQTAKGTYVRDVGASGVARQAYGAQTTVPQIEDVGEARLTNGRADVAIDAALGDTIDMRYGYHVFVTPEGDSKGLYVSAKAATGFVVREAQGGRTSMSFEYRIVAKPLRANEARLAISPALPQDRDATVLARARPHAIPERLTPEARLRARLGPAGYARVVSERRSLPMR